MIKQYSFHLFLRLVSSMLSFPLWYNFPLLSMRITSWIVKKGQSMLNKIVCKNIELRATFFVRIVRFLINLWFATNPIEEADKQTKLRWRVVDHNHIRECYQYRKEFRTVYYACTFLPTTAAATTTATTTNNATVTTVLHKWASKIYMKPIALKIRLSVKKDNFWNYYIE